MTEEKNSASFFTRGAALAAVLALAALLRLGGLWWGLPNANHVTSYNCDEYTLLASLQGMDPARGDFNPVSEKDPYALATGTFHMYTFGAALKALAATGWLKLTGDKEYYYAHPDEWGRFFLAGRAMSAVYGLLTVWLVFLLARRAYGPPAGLLAALFAAVMPALAIHSRFMTTNMPGLFWITLALYLLKNILDRGAWRDYLLAGAAAGLAAATRYSAAPLLPMLFVAHFLRPEPLRGLAKPFAAAGSMVFFFLLGVPYALLDYPSFRLALSAVKQTATAGGAPSLLGNLSFVGGQLAEAAGLPLLLLGLAGIGAAAARRAKDDLLLLAWTLPLLLVFVNAGYSATGGRMLPVLPVLAVLAGGLLAAWLKKAPHAAAAALGASLLFLALFHAAAFRLVLSEDPREAASDWLRAEAKPKTSIGLIREPSWSGPGVLDRHYRHPGHGLLPGTSLVSLTSGDWSSVTGYDLLAAKKPALVVFSDVEAGYLNGPGLEEALAASGYSRTKEFKADFSLCGVKLLRRLPRDLYIPNSVSVFAAKGKN